MKFHQKIYDLIRNRYFSIQLFFSVIGLKTFSGTIFVLKSYVSRLSTELLVIAPLVMILILAINILRPDSQFDIAKKNVLANNSDFGAHIFLAQQFFVINQFDKAETEAELGLDTEMIDRVQKIKNQPEEIKKEILMLQKIAENFPNYRDAYLKLAILNWKIYRPLDTKKYLEKVLAIDPNNELANKFLEQVESAK